MRMMKKRYPDYLLQIYTLFLNVHCRVNQYIDENYLKIIRVFVLPEDNPIIPIDHYTIRQLLLINHEALRQ